MSFDEYFPFEGPEKPKKPNRRSSTGKPRFHRAKSTDRVYDKPVDLDNEARPGTHEYRCLVVSRTAQFRNHPGFPNYRKTGTPCGMSRDEAREKWAVARQEAKDFVEILMSQNLISDSEYSRECLEGIMEIARGPMTSTRDRLSAYSIVLKACKAAPAAEQKLTISSAESWLSQVVSHDVTDLPLIEAQDPILDK